MRTYKIKFISGDIAEISKPEYTRLIQRFNTSNRNFARFFTDSGEMMMIENIERIIPQGVEDPVEIDEPKAEVIDKKLTDLDLARKEAMAELMAKSNCKHETNQDVYKTDTKTGPRFFTLCSFCGGNRSRFIALKDLSDEQLQNAKEWVEKE